MGTKYGSFKQIEDMEGRIKRMETTKANPALWASIVEKPKWDRKLKGLKERHARMKPPPVAESDRPKLEARKAELEAFMRLPCPEIKKPAMPSKQTMEENPAGAVGEHILWERGVLRYNVDASGKPVLNPKYNASDELKDLNRRLYWEESEVDEDVSNHEKIRSESRDRQASEYRRMNFAQGAGIPQAQWDETVGPRPQPTRTEAVPEKSAPSTKRRKRHEYTPEEKAAIAARLKNAREAKRAAAQA